MCRWVGSAGVRFFGGFFPPFKTYLLIIQIQNPGDEAAKSEKKSYINVSSWSAGETIHDRFTSRVSARGGRALRNRRHG